MSFGLKNVGTIHHHIVNLMFDKKIGEMMEVHINDMLFK